MGVMGMLDGEMEGGDEEENEPETVKEKQDEKKEESNVSSVNLAFQDSKIPFKGSFSPVAFTNWCWFRTIRPKLSATKGSMPDLDPNMDYGIDLVEEVLGQYVPAGKKDDKKDKKDDKKKKKEKIELNKLGQAQAEHCIKDM